MGFTVTPKSLVFVALIFIICHAEGYVPFP